MTIAMNTLQYTLQCHWVRSLSGIFNISPICYLTILVFLWLFSTPLNFLPSFLPASQSLPLHLLYPHWYFTVPAKVVTVGYCHLFAGTRQPFVRERNSRHKKKTIGSHIIFKHLENLGHFLPVINFFWTIPIKFSLETPDTESNTRAFQVQFFPSAHQMTMQTDCGFLKYLICSIS